MEQDKKKADIIFIVLIALIILNAIFIIYTSIYVWGHQLDDTTERYFESVNTLLIGSLISEILGGFLYNCIKKHTENTKQKAENAVDVKEEG